MSKTNAAATAGEMFIFIKRLPKCPLRATFKYQAHDRLLYGWRATISALIRAGRVHRELLNLNKLLFC
jgi:hypothetical protein